MRRLSPIPALLGIVLLGACGQAMASELRQSADGGDSCPDSATTANDRVDDTEAGDATAPATSTKRNAKAKAVAAPRNAGGNRSTAPRWHSFLPGMFR